MDLPTLQRHWHTFAERDALWSILTHQGKQAGSQGGGWGLAEFMAIGEADIRDVLLAAQRVGLPIARGRALDFGCGVGRLTQALAAHMESCIGVDIAPGMIERANALNRHGARCRYHVNATDDLGLFGDATFDLVLSALVLQHIEPRFAAAYIREFFRVVQPGRPVILQLPVHDLGNTPPVTAAMSADDPLLLPEETSPVMEMHAMAIDTVESVIQRSGGRLLAAVPVADVLTRMTPGDAMGSHYFYAQRIP